MSVDITVDDLTWNGSRKLDRVADNTLSDTVQVDMSGGDGQFLFVFQNTANDTLGVQVATGSEFWMHPQGTVSFEDTKATDSDPVVAGPFEGGRFKDGSDNKITFTMSMSDTGSIDGGNAWMHALKVPKG